MSQAVEVDLRQLVVADSAFGPKTVKQISDTLAEGITNYRTLRDAVAELEQKPEQTPASKVRLGVNLYLLGRYRRAIEMLSESDGGPLALFYKGKAQAALEQNDEALKSFEAAAKAGYSGDDCSVARSEVLRHKRDPHAALAALDALSGAIEQSAEYLFQRGATIAMIGGNPKEVCALFERAVDADPTHPAALFGLALENDRRGNDDTALHLYERSVAHFPPHIGALMNLGILYEDRGHMDRALQCYQRVLDVFPDHARARLFAKDVDATGDMFYDEDAQRKRDRLSQMLSVPVTDFELSVRSRNCLQKMGVMTLGDLTTTSEQELLASKNFGETSLTEIKEMMASKGLSLGQFANDKGRLEAAFEPETVGPDEQALLGRPISELNLSVRARKCMIRLGLATIGDLVRHTGDELLECKNFGVTSLNEVREKLTGHNLKLRGD